MFSKIVLALWSIAGLVWWVLAWRLVTADQRRKGAAPEPVLLRTLSVFKPVPCLGAQGLKVVAAGLESFVAQLDSGSELLLGIHEADRDFITRTSGAGQIQRAAHESFVDSFAGHDVIFGRHPGDVR